MSSARRILTAASALALASAFSGAPAARAELAKWDQAKVAALATQLVAATDALNDTFYKQPPPSVASMQSRDYYRLKQQVRHLRSEARELSASLGKNAGFDETLPIYDDLMQVVRLARETARGTFTTQDVIEKATAVRLVLNQLTPYYDADAIPLEPVSR